MFHYCDFLCIKYCKKNSFISFFPIFNYPKRTLPIPVAARSKAWDFGRSLTGIVGSNPAGDMDVCVVFVVRTVAWNVK